MYMYLFGLFDDSLENIRCEFSECIICDWMCYSDW